MKICFVTGGTGGHIYPALALADKVKQLYPDTQILFIGNNDRMEADLIPSYGYDFNSLYYTLRSTLPQGQMSALLFSL